MVGYQVWYMALLTCQCWGRPTCLMKECNLLFWPSSIPCTTSWWYTTKLRCMEKSYKHSIYQHLQNITLRLNFNNFFNLWKVKRAPQSYLLKTFEVFGRILTKFNTDHYRVKCLITPIVALHIVSVGRVM